jgi:radical SAM protein (TIGR01212 family)
VKGSDVSQIELAPAEYRSKGQRYYRLSYWLKQKFGHSVFKACLDAGFSCPNLDGTLSHGGCIFCDHHSFSPTTDVRLLSIADQVAKQVRKWERISKNSKYLAYFQNGTNTYADPQTLKALYDAALIHPKIVGLVIGTRPDCVNDEVLDLIASYQQRSFVNLELGMQSSHDRSLEWMNRGHHNQCLDEAVAKCHARKVPVGLHVILGLPGESTADMIATAHKINALKVHAVKIHNLYVTKTTRLSRLHAEGKLHLPSLDEYLDILINFIENLDPAIVVERLVSESPPEYLVEPSWILDKKRFLLRFEQEMEIRDTWQGRKLGF